MKSSMLHKGLIVIGVILISIVWQTASMIGDQYPIKNFPPKGGKVLVLGDSLTVGVGASRDEKNYIGVLESRLGTTIINKGVSGDTTARALLRLDRDVLMLRPDIVMILLGSNDYLTQIPEKETFENLRSIIHQIQERGAVVILLGTRGGALHDTFEEDFEALAEKEGALFVPNVLDGIIGTSKLMSDEIHPNDAGYLKIADKIAPTLESALRAVIDLSEPVR